jgi:putative pyoverdin transport system ATP-binding/permease protein
MKLMLTLFQRSGRRLLLLAGLGAISGLSTAALLAGINEVLRRHSAAPALVIGFVGVLILKMTSTFASRLLLVRFAQDTVLDLSLGLSEKVIRTPFRRLELIGTGRILATLTEDIAILSTAILAIPTLTVHAAIVVSCSGYLAWVSPRSFLASLVLASIGVFAHRILLGRAHTAIRLAFETRDRLFERFRMLTDGIKELQLNAARTRVFLEQDMGNIVGSLRDQNVLAMTQYSIAEACSQASFYGLLVVLLFVLPGSNWLSADEITTFVIAVIYCMTPVWGILGSLPTLSLGYAALVRLEEIGNSLGPETPVEVEIAATRHSPPEIRFESVRFTYLSNQSGDGGFTLGPLNLELGPGELVMVIGGNGSGKSTFAKLLTGLYTPDSGRILVDGECTTAGNGYREMFSAVFSDFYLFERLYQSANPELLARGSHYLQALQLEKKVFLRGDAFSTTALSQGQRRRLALVAAYLEDRPVYVLDEWAADQDPSFRRVFYEVLLPDLRARNKSVVVITHDDRYFHLADRLIKLDCGRIADSREPSVELISHSSILVLD